MQFWKSDPCDVTRGTVRLAEVSECVEGLTQTLLEQEAKNQCVLFLFVFLFFALFFVVDHL